jgi:hypothetical protein
VTPDGATSCPSAGVTMQCTRWRFSTSSSSSAEPPGLAVPFSVSSPSGMTTVPGEAGAAAPCSRRR